MKKFLQITLGLICVTALFAACAEEADGGCNLPWTLSCLAIAAASGYGFGKITDKDTVTR